MLVAERQRAKRVDAGHVRQTARDAALLEWMAHMYGIPLDLLQRGLDVSQVRSYQLVQRWKKAGWVRTAKADPGATWVWPTRAVATQYLGWDADWTPRPTTTGHVRAVVAVRLHRAGFELGRWESERALRHAEGGFRRKDVPEKHVPDGVEILPDGRRVLIEVELTAKSPERMKQTVMAVSNRAHDLGCYAIAYWCTPAAMNAVRAAIEQHRKEWNRPQDNEEWVVMNIEEVPGWTVEARA